MPNVLLDWVIRPAAPSPLLLTDFPLAPCGLFAGDMLTFEGMPMSGSTEQPKDAARRKAQNYFTQTERRDELVRQELEKERVAGDAKIAKLRALRLAKEAVDKVESDRVAAEKAEAKANAPKKPLKSRRPPKT
jgi:hypothetical protein